MDTLKKVEGLRIRRISGSSAGAWCAVFFTCGKSTSDWADSYRRTADNMADGCALLEAYVRMRDVIPDDAHLRCNNRVFISITTVSLAGVIHSEVISEFHSRDDLIDACVASSTIPGLTGALLGGHATFRGKTVLDGGILNNTPLFRGNDRRQIVVDLANVAYSGYLSFTAADPCIEGLVIRGALEARRFVDGHGGSGTSIGWVAKDAVVADCNSVASRAWTVMFYGSLVLASAPVLLLVRGLQTATKAVDSAVGNVSAAYGRAIPKLSLPNKVLVASMVAGGLCTLK